MVFGPTKEITKKEDLAGIAEDDKDSDDPDFNEDEKEQKGKWVDFIGNIEEKLTANKLKYVKQEIPQVKQKEYDYMQVRHYRDALKKFKEKYRDDLLRSYPHQNRFIVMVDTREEACRDIMYLYEPPSNCRDIPIDAVPEYGLSASRTCLLPNIGYKAFDAEHAKLNGDQNDKNKKVQNANVSIASHCKGQLLTLSFQVIQKNEIRIYLYWSGQMIRFYPSDMKDILPRIFNMGWNNEENRSFLNGTDIDSVINRMSNCDLENNDRGRIRLLDEKFIAFQTWSSQA